tara:strand:- start:42064 stop:42879 length:816 start_codon:yes stop_codon:yes gene_type:complete
MAKNTKKKFRVGVAARTVDGREIKSEWIKKAAALYSPEVYGARINLEHIRGVLPESAFSMLGDVLSLEFTQEDIGGVKRDVIYAELEPNDELIAMNKKGQKVYTSMELQPDFPNEGDFYMVGLAVTDSPASMGTQRLSFNAAKTGKNMIGEYSETEFMFSDDENEDDDRPGILERITKMFSGLKKVTDSKNGELELAIESIAEEFTNFAKSIPSDNSSEVAELKAQLQLLKTNYSALKLTCDELSTAMEGTEKFNRRPPATGGDGEEQVDY